MNKTKLKKILICSIFIIGITAFFIIPLIEFKSATEYEVFIKNRMGTINSYNDSKIELSRLIHTGDEILSFELGISTIVGLLLTPFALKKIENKYKVEYILFFVLGVICLLMTLKIIPINLFGEFSTFIQFAWRFLEFSTFFLSVVVSINLGTCILNFNIKDVIILGIIMILAILPLKSHFKYESAFNEKDLLEEIPVTENTGRVHPGCAKFEYLPQKAFKNLDYIKTRKDEIYVLDGNVNIYNYDKNIKNLTAKIHSEKVSLLELPYVYYPGYTVKLQTQTQKINLKTYETENGFVGIQIPEKLEGELEVKYTGTKLMQISKIITIISFIILLLYIKHY